MAVGQTANVGGTKVYKGFENDFKDAKSELGQIGKMRDQIQNDDSLSPAQKDLAMAKLDNAEKALNDALDAMTLGSKFDVNSGSTVKDNDIDGIRELLHRVADKLEDAMEVLASATGGAGGANGTTSVDPPSGSGGTSGTSGADGAGSTDKAGGADKAGSSGGTSGAQNTDPANNDSLNNALDLVGQGGTAVMDAYNDNPQEFMNSLKDLDPTDRQMMMQQLQEQMQMMNQMFSMMTNMMKMMHDTAKAAINNMRV